jgi:hypothetical protein
MAEGTFMEQASNPARPAVNRRASRRAPLRGTIVVECRKGSLGLGPNLVVYPLDISETGVRVVLKAELKRGQEVEVVIMGGGYTRPLKKRATVIWSVPSADNAHVTGIRFDGYVPFADLQGMTKPPRMLK